MISPRLLCIAIAVAVIVLGGSLVGTFQAAAVRKKGEREAAGRASQVGRNGDQSGGNLSTKPDPARHESKSSHKPPEHLTPVAITQRSIRDGMIKEFTSDHVKDWQVGETEELEGEVFLTGIAVYRAETIFGEAQVQAKAYIKDGKVEKWVYPRTGMAIR